MSDRIEVLIACIVIVKNMIYQKILLILFPMITPL